MPSVHKGLTDEVTRRGRDGSFVELLIRPTIDRVDGAELDPIELDLVLGYPDDLVVIALAGHCPEPSKTPTALSGRTTGVKIA